MGRIPAAESHALSEPRPRIWALLGHRRGDNFQVLALAQGLGLPFETRSLRYNVVRRLDNRLLGRSLVSVLPSSARWLQPPWPDLVIAIGQRSVPVARFIRHASRGKTKLVQLGNPRMNPNIFDLVITLPQYAIGKSDRVVQLPFAMGSPHAPEPPTEVESEILDALPRPHRLMVLGGPNKHWQIPPEIAVSAARTLVERCDREGGTVIAIGSPRTPPAVAHAVEQALDGTRHRFVGGSVPRYVSLLEDADEIHVTADSVSMLSEAVFTGKPVGMIPIPATPRGRLRQAVSNRGLLPPPRPDLRAFWTSLEQEGIVGTLQAPRSAEVDDPTRKAVGAVLRLLGISRRQ
ncbi:MAG: ELM1/GtrOC1 family putative glycosyltransferase [Sphingomicrobium sp.]